ncbi:phage baseplate assembly protein V [Caballeronia sordidicola]|uniref:Prophage baseplate assembly protein V n=1 Tax=Caballeronia sordidicola TaxID=196367 RepID=A0A242N8L4_CABSO|nr:phage baseplate assembly protein V [Caballeronia sordidicola]OTP79496.1 Prophage baseplate assembly protein V [Caballeronia sordidicola]
MMVENIGRLARRILLMLARGTITLVDDSKTVQSVQVRVNALELIPDVPRFAEYGYTSNPPAGTQAVLGAKNGDRNDVIVIATSNATYRLTGLATGEMAIHDDKGQSVYLSAGGIIIKGGGLPITLTDTPKIRAETPLLECTGDIVDNCDTTGRSMAADRVIYDGHDHDVRNVQGGGSTIRSDPPTAVE